MSGKSAYSNAARSNDARQKGGTSKATVGPSAETEFFTRGVSVSQKDIFYYFFSESIALASLLYQRPLQLNDDEKRLLRRSRLLYYFYEKHRDRINSFWQIYFLKRFLKIEQKKAEYYTHEKNIFLSMIPMFFPLDENTFDVLDALVGELTLHNKMGNADKEAYNYVRNLLRYYHRTIHNKISDSMVHSSNEALPIQNSIINSYLNFLNKCKSDNVLHFMSMINLDEVIRSFFDRFLKIGEGYTDTIRSIEKALMSRNDYCWYAQHPNKERVYAPIGFSSDFSLVSRELFAVPLSAFYLYGVMPDIDSKEAERLLRMFSYRRIHDIVRNAPSHSEEIDRLAEEASVAKKNFTIMDNLETRLSHLKKRMRKQLDTEIPTLFASDVFLSKEQSEQIVSVCEKIRIILIVNMKNIPRAESSYYKEIRGKKLSKLVSELLDWSMDKYNEHFAQQAVPTKSIEEEATELFKPADEIEIDTEKFNLNEGESNESLEDIEFSDDYDTADEFQ